jgi:hypothetical protein
MFQCEALMSWLQSLIVASVLVNMFLAAALVLVTHGWRQVKNKK